MDVVISEDGQRSYKVTYDYRSGAWHCSCPARVPCKHIASTRYHHHYNLSYRAYLAATAAELLDADDAFKAGRIMPTSSHPDEIDAEADVLGDVIAERWSELERRGGR